MLNSVMCSITGSQASPFIRLQCPLEADPVRWASLLIHELFISMCARNLPWIGIFVSGLEREAPDCARGVGRADLHVAQHLPRRGALVFAVSIRVNAIIFAAASLSLPSGILARWTPLRGRAGARVDNRAPQESGAALLDGRGNLHPRVLGVRSLPDEIAGRGAILPYPAVRSR